MKATKQIESRRNEGLFDMWRICVKDSMEARLKFVQFAIRLGNGMKTHADFCGAYFQPRSQIR